MTSEAAGREEQGMVEIRLTQNRAEAVEREGLAAANVLREKMQAQAVGNEDQLMVEVRVKEASAQAIEKEGMAQAKVLREKAEAEASGNEKLSMAAALGIRERLVAEADGLAKKAEAMKALDAVSRDHEEFRLALEHERTLSIERFKAQVDVARAQSEVMGEAFKTSNINIVGGDEAFFNRFTNAVSMGQAVDGFLANSDVARRALSRVLGDDQAADVASVISGLASKGPSKDASNTEVVDEA